jgi:hypothetical protein
LRIWRCGRKRRGGAARQNLGIGLVRENVHLSWFFPAVLQDEALGLQIFFAVLDGKVEVGVTVRWRWLSTCCWWAAGRAWTGRKTRRRWRRRVEVPHVVHVSPVVDHHLWCGYRESQRWRSIGCHDSLRREECPLHLRWLPVLRCSVVSRWVSHMLSIDWLFLSHWREDSIVSVLGVWSVLVELDLGMSHVVLILVHRTLRKSDHKRTS